MLKNWQYGKWRKLCGRCFVLMDQHIQERPYKGKQTCQQMGSKLSFEKGMEINAFLQQYPTEYNKVYSRPCRAAEKYAEGNTSDEESLRGSNWIKKREG